MPFIWRDPKGPRGKRSDAFAGTIDLAPTILARAGVQGFNGIQGKDLLPLIAGGTAPYEDFLIEEEGQRLGVGLPTRARVRSLLTARYRLTLKGPDRGKWETNMVAEADAPLMAVDAVVRGVQRRSGDVDAATKMEGDEVRAVLGTLTGNLSA